MAARAEAISGHSHHDKLSHTKGQADRFRALGAIEETVQAMRVQLWMASARAAMLCALPICDGHEDLRPCSMPSALGQS